VPYSDPHDRQNGVMVQERTRPSAVATIAAAVGAVLLIVSPFLVWGKVEADLGIISATVSATGMDSGYGWITLVLGLAVAGVAIASWAGMSRRAAASAWLAIAVVAAGLTVYELTQVHDCALDLFDECVATPTYGPGLFVALAGAAATLVAAVAAWVRPRATG
jgi:O-antigen ligase